MPSDIILADDAITLEGEVGVGTLRGIAGSALIVKATDLILEHGEYRRPDSDSTIPRRALVHSSDDGLIVNYKGSYPGGVTIDGQVRVRKLFIVGEGATTVTTTSDPGIPILPLIQDLDLMEEIRSLRARIAALEAIPH